MIRRTLTILAALPAAAVAGPLADTFGPGIRGVSWEACDPESALPGGKWQKQGLARLYVVRDDKAFLGIQRARRNEIQIACNTEGTAVTSITVTFPGSDSAFMALMQVMAENFGPHEAERHGVAAETFAGLNYSWVDGDLMASVSRFTTGLTSSNSLTIARTATTAAKSRQELGLE